MTVIVLLAAGCGGDDGVAVSGIALDRQQTVLVKGSTVQLTATVQPDNADNQRIRWNSSDDGVAAVSSNGNVTGIEPGNAVITVVTVDGGFSAQCQVTVQYGGATAVELDSSSVQLGERKTLQLQATVRPVDATNKQLVWISSNTNFVTVTNGLLYGVQPGNTVVAVKTVDGGHVALCSITVIDWIDVTNVALDYSSVDLEIGKTLQLQSTVLPADANDRSVTWRSSNQTVAAVDQQGNVSGLTVGTAVITVTSSDMNLTAVCTVNVIPRPLPFETVDYTNFSANGWSIPGNNYFESYLKFNETGETAVTPQLASGVKSVAFRIKTTIIASTATLAFYGSTDGENFQLISSGHGNNGSSTVGEHVISVGSAPLLESCSFFKFVLENNDTALGLDSVLFSPYNLSATDATLSSMTVDPDLNLIFFSSNTNYSANVDNGTASVQLTAVLSDSNASFTVNGAPGTSGQPLTVSGLTEGTNRITVSVTAADNQTQKNYLLDLNVLPVSGAALPFETMQYTAFIPDGWQIPDNGAYYTTYVKFMQSGETALTPYLASGVTNISFSIKTGTIASGSQLLLAGSTNGNRFFQIGSGFGNDGSSTTGSWSVDAVSWPWISGCRFFRFEMGTDDGTIGLDSVVIQ